MENSILKSTKKILGIAPDYTVFDLDIITHINSALSIANQLGIGPVDGLFIEDDETVWADLIVPANQLSLLRTYVGLKVRALFDPPTTSFMIDAMNAQIREHEWRLNMSRENLIPLPDSEVEVV